MIAKEVSPVVLSLVGRIHEVMELYRHASERFTEKYVKNLLQQAARKKELHYKELANIFDVNKEDLLQAVRQLDELEVEKEKLNFNHKVEIDEEKPLWNYFISLETRLVKLYQKVDAEQRFDEFQQAVILNQVSEVKRELNELQKHAELT